MFRFVFVRRAIVSLILLCSGLIISGCATTNRPVVETVSIRNFAQVDENLYRGAQPDARSIEALARMGVKTIVNLRMTNEVWPKEQEAARAAGIAYIHVPMSGIGRPTNEQVSNVLAILETSPRPVFVHCQFGRDRTGTIVACYRIAHDNWNERRALLEAKRYGLSRWELGMKHYIKDFATSRKVAQTPATTQTLAPLVPAIVPPG